MKSVRGYTLSVCVCVFVCVCVHACVCVFSVTWFSVKPVLPFILFVKHLRRFCGISDGFCHQSMCL